MKIKANNTGGPVTRKKIVEEETFTDGGYPKAQRATGKPIPKEVMDPSPPNSPPTEGLIEGPVLTQEPLYRGKPTKRQYIDLKESDAMSFQDKVQASYRIRAIGEPAVVTEEPKAPPPTAPPQEEKAPPRPPAQKINSFNEAIAELKKDFSGLRQKFPKPPTYVWDSKEDITQEDVKDMLKVKFPKLAWTFRADGVPTAYVQFPDGTNLELTLGYRGAMLTVTLDQDGDQYF